MSDDRFKSQFKSAYNTLFKTSSGYEKFYNNLSEKVKFADKCNPAVLACACLYMDKTTDEIMDRCVNFLVDTNKKLDVKKHKRELKMDILRYYKVLNSGKIENTPDSDSDSDSDSE